MKNYSLYLFIYIISCSSCCDKGGYIQCITNNNLKLYIDKDLYLKLSNDAKQSFRLSYKNNTRDIVFELRNNGINDFSYEIDRIDSAQNVDIILMNSKIDVTDTFQLYSFNLINDEIDQSCGFNKDVLSTD